MHQARLRVLAGRVVPGLPEPAPADLASVPELTESVLVLLVLVLVVVLILVLILVPGFCLLSWS